MVYNFSGMFLFLLPYSPVQKKLAVRDCSEDRFSLEEFEPLARSLEKRFVRDATLAPLHRRFGGPFWESLELWILPPPVVNYIREHAWVLSPLYGLLKPTACIPYAVVSWQTTFEGKELIDFWKPHIRNISRKILEESLLVPFVGSRYLRLFNLKAPKGVLRFEYYRRDKRVINPAKHYAYTLRYIAEKGVSVSDLERINFYDYRVESVEQKGRDMVVVLRSEGRYEL